MSKHSLTAISLFTSAGIGDLALRACGFDILASAEVVEDRHALFKHNFPSTRGMTGDIWETQEELVSVGEKALNGRELTLLYLTPPCQGMSKNGQGKLLSEIRKGNRPKLDPRNRLIIPAMAVARRFRPKLILLENVPQMANTVIEAPDGSLVTILQFIEDSMGSEYVGRGEVIEFADYGVPQCRQRLVSVFARDESLKDWFQQVGSFMPIRTHTKNGGLNQERWVTVRETIGKLPPLDAKNSAAAESEIPYHRVSVLDEMKYWWVSSTPPGKTAFDNQCTECGFNKNPLHRAEKDTAGINKASGSTPLYCQECGKMLPRPSVERGGARVLMKGYTSAYKRMAYDSPASALTRNFAFVCSDNKVHPEQNRALSILEAFMIHTISNYKYEWHRSDGKTVTDTLIRESIGESVPPLGLEIILRHIIAILRNQKNAAESLGPIFSSKPAQIAP